LGRRISLGFKLSTLTPSSIHYRLNNPHGRFARLMAVLEGGINPRGGSLLGRWHLVEPLPRRAHFWPESLCFAALCPPAPLAAPLVSPVVSPLVSLSPDGCPSSIVHLSSMCYLSTPTKWSNSASDFYCVSTSEPSVLRQHTWLHRRV
jgi:hypothetical protein